MPLKQEAIPKKPISFAIWASEPVKGWALLAICSVLIASIFSRGQVYLVKMIIDSATGIGDFIDATSTTLYWVWAYIAIHGLTHLLWRSSGFSGMRWITGISAEIYKRLYSYLTGHSSAYFSDRYAGSLTNKISNAASGIENLLAQTLWEFGPVIVGLVAEFTIAWIAHPQFAAVLLFWILIYGIVNYFLFRRLHPLAFSHAEAASDLKGKLVDSASNIDTIQFSGEVDFEKRYIGGFIDKYRGAHLREWFFSEWILVSNGVLMLLFTGSMLMLGINLLEANEITIGTLVMIITLLSNLERTLFFIGQTAVRAVTYHGQVTEGLVELLEPYAITDHANSTDITAVKGKIEYGAVTFSYDSTQVLEDFNLLIPSGERVGLVGPSGAGKSTLVNLLLRQFDVQKGSIKLDEHPIDSLSLDSLRKAVALVPQTTSLFHRTIFENIRYGRLDATEEEVIHAAKLAEAHQFISTLERGYETYVGERGVKLSGGQRQRISIARAMLKNAPILILDEATSALDSESEAAIQAALEKLMKGKTVLAIAHRLSTLKVMDRLIVIDKGKIIEDGTHQELLEQNGLYASLWNRQVSGFIQDS